MQCWKHKTSTLDYFVKQVKISQIYDCVETCYIAEGKARRNCMINDLLINPAKDYKYEQFGSRT